MLTPALSCCQILRMLPVRAKLCSWTSRWTQDPAVLTVSQLSSLFSCLSTIFIWSPNLRFSSIIKSFLHPSGSNFLVNVYIFPSRNISLSQNSYTPSFFVTVIVSLGHFPFSLIYQGSRVRMRTRRLEARVSLLPCHSCRSLLSSDRTLFAIRV